MLTFEDQLATTPSALEEYISLPVLGGDLLIFEGQFTLNSDENDGIVSGKVFYSFCEKIELLFEGKTLIKKHLDWVGKKAYISAGDNLIGEALVLQIQGDRINGFITHIENKQSTSCERFRWCYLNAPKIFGDGVRRGRNVATDRLVFQAGGYQVKLENVAGFQPQKRHRKISHICELTRQDGEPITAEAAIDEIQLFSRFVSFFAGCQHAPFFIEGLDGVAIRYEFHSVGHDKSLVGVSSWKPDFKERDLVGLWPNFRSKRYESPDRYDVLNTVIHWYLEANMNSGLLEGAVLLGFTGLELLSNEIVGKELGNQEIVEDFLTRLHIRIKLKPEEISLTRNYLTHYKTEERRRRYTSLTFEEKFFRLEIILHILELAILYWLGYEGHYKDRFGSKWRGEDVELVPWMS